MKLLSFLSLLFVSEIVFATISCPEDVASVGVYCP